MKIITDYIPLSSKGFTDIIDITSQVAGAIHRSEIKSGTVTVFISGSRMLLGTWQQIVVVDFDNRSRNREVVVQMMGE